VCLRACVHVRVRGIMRECQFEPHCAIDRYTIAAVDRAVLDLEASELVSVRPHELRADSVRRRDCRRRRAALTRTDGEQTSSGVRAFNSRRRCKWDSHGSKETRRSGSFEIESETDCWASARGTVRHGPARPGVAQQCVARPARPGNARHGTARHGTARPGNARHGTAWHGTARRGTAGVVHTTAVARRSSTLLVATTCS
jgi:hypothetical protein